MKYVDQGLCFVNNDTVGKEKKYIACEYYVKRDYIKEKTLSNTNIGKTKFWLLYVGMASLNVFGDINFSYDNFFLLTVV